MKEIGITGGIGAGKTMVAKVFEHLGYPVYYADKRAKQLYVENKNLRFAVLALFGTEAFCPDKSLNTAHIAKEVFNNTKRLHQLNALVHPLVSQDYDQWKEQQTSSLIFKEAAILFETGGHTKLDKSLLVCADKETRISRVMKRDGVSREAVLDRMSKQWSDEQKKTCATHVIYNNDNAPILANLLQLLSDWL